MNHVMNISVMPGLVEGCKLEYEVGHLSIVVIAYEYTWNYVYRFDTRTQYLHREQYGSMVVDLMGLNK